MADGTRRDVTTALRPVNALRTTLEDRRLSQIDLADLSGVPYTTVQRIVRPDSNPFLDDALRITRILGAPMAELFWLPAR